MKKQYITHALAIVEWHDKARMALRLSPSDASLAMTAKFAHDDEPKLFSVVLQSLLIDDVVVSQQFELHFFAPQLIVHKLEIGTILHLTDGYKIVGKATIIEIMR